MHVSFLSCWQLLSAVIVTTRTGRKYFLRIYWILKSISRRRRVNQVFYRKIEHHTERFELQLNYLSILFSSMHNLFSRTKMIYPCIASRHTQHWCERDFVLVQNALLTYTGCPSGLVRSEDQAGDPAPPQKIILILASFWTPYRLLL